VVLYFYPKDFTTGCTIEAHNFQRDLAQYEQKNAVIIGVSVQDEDSHQKFCTKEGLSFKLLADTKQEVSTRYDSVMTYNEAKYSARTLPDRPARQSAKSVARSKTRQAQRKKCWLRSRSYKALQRRSSCA